MFVLKLLTCAATLHGAARSPSPPVHGPASPRIGVCGAGLGPAARAVAARVAHAVSRLRRGHVALLVHVRRAAVSVDLGLVGAPVLPPVGLLGAGASVPIAGEDDADPAHAHDEDGQDEPDEEVPEARVELHQR